ncbi:UrcA family protein [Tsuneonella sp. HG249]
MRTPLIALTALTLIAGVPAAAEDFVVRYDDLDLASPKGQKALDKRIDAAARAYCGVGVQRTGTRVKGSNTAQCYQSARNAAREKMAALVEQKSKGG